MVDHRQLRPPDDVTIVVPSSKAGPLLRACLSALADSILAADCRAGVVVIDNGAPAGEVAGLAAPHGFSVVRNEVNRGFAAPMNDAMLGATSPWVIALNDDTEVDRDWLATLWAAVGAEPQVWALSSRLVFHNDTSVVHSDGIAVDTSGRPADLHGGLPVVDLPDQPFEIFGASGGAAAYRTETLVALGGYPAEFFAYYEDVDLAWRARRRGLVTLCVPAAVVRHHVAATSGPRSALKAKLGARNYLWLLARNMRAEDLAGHRREIVAYQLAYVAGSGRRAGAALAGTAAGLVGWRTQRARSVDGRSGSTRLDLDAHLGLRRAYLARRERLRRNVH